MLWCTTVVHRVTCLGALGRCNMGQLTGGPHATLIGCLGAASLCLFCRSPNTQFRTESLRYNIHTTTTWHR